MKGREKNVTEVSIVMWFVWPADVQFYFYRAFFCYAIAKVAGKEQTKTSFPQR